MDELNKQVARAQRRLAFQRFLGICTWCLFGALLVAVGLVLANWRWGFVPLGTVKQQAAMLAGGAAGAGLLLAMVLTVLFRRPRLDAAMELDQRFGLKERVSSALSLDDVTLDSEAGQALTADAQRRVRHLHVGERFGISLSPWSLLPLVPAVAVFLLALFLPEFSPPGEAEGKENLVALRKEIQRKIDPLKNKLEQRRKEAREKGLKELEKEIAKFQREMEKTVNAKEKIDRKDAVVKLNNLAKELQDRRKKLGSNDNLKNQLGQLKGMGGGPGEKLAQALKNGDLKQAIRAIDDLMKKLKDGKLDPAQQKKLAAQLDQMKQKLQNMIDAQKKKQQQLQDQIAQAKKQGNNALAQQLQRQLDKMKQQQGQMNQLDKMAQQLGKCANCLKQGKAGEAQAGLQGMKGQLQQLKQQLDEMQMLDGALDDIAAAKNAILDDQFGMMQGQGQNGQGQQAGDGLGQGQGKGFRPENKTDGNKFVESRVKQKVSGPGTATVIGETNGPNLKGNIRETIKGNFQAGIAEESDPVNVRQLPKGVRSHVKEYIGYFNGTLKKKEKE